MAADVTKSLRMADIFLSYSSTDRPFAERLATALRGEGWSVWWDRNIPHGGDFNDTLQRELDLAKCIVVLWSDSALQSKFVRDEATEGLNDGRLVPVLIHKVRQPLGFRQLQAADLSEWRGGEQTPDFIRLSESIAAVLGSVRVRAVRPDPPHPGRRLTAIISVVAFAVFAGWQLISWISGPTETTDRRPGVTTGSSTAPSAAPSKGGTAPAPSKSPSVTQVPPTANTTYKEQGLPPNIGAPHDQSLATLPPAPPLGATVFDEPGGLFKVRVGTFQGNRAIQVERDLRQRGFPVRSAPFGTGHSITVEPYHGFENALKANAALIDHGYNGGAIERIQ
jgi:hypothetical protein